MILSEGRYEGGCKECGRGGKYVPPVIGCDFCGKVVEEDDALELRVFWKDDSREVDRYSLCSWACSLKKARTISTDYFIDLPTLMGRRLDEFWSAIYDMKEGD